jgi:acid phosphatase
MKESMNRRDFLIRFVKNTAAFFSAAFFLSVSSIASSIRLLWGEKQVHNQKHIAPFVHSTFSSISSIRFFAIGDWGAGGAFQRRVANSLIAYAAIEKPQFVISTGDNFYPKGSSSVDDTQFTTKWKKMYSIDTMNIPWYCALGNHDYGGDVETQVKHTTLDPLWNMPARYFHFARTEADITCDFFVLDTEVFYHKNHDDSKKQFHWLEQELQKSEARWKVVVGHHPIRSHGAYGDQKIMLKHIKPLLDRYKVQLYFNGHDHDLQYLKSSDDYFACICSGAGGGARNTSYGKNTLFATTNGGFVSIAITQNELIAQFLNANGLVIFEDTVFRIE